MRFVWGLHRLLDCILSENPKMVPTYLLKFDMSEMCMHIWAWTEDVPSVALLIPEAVVEEEQLVGFHLSIPMVYMESVAFFFIATKSVKDRALANINSQPRAPS